MAIPVPAQTRTTPTPLHFFNTASPEHTVSTLLTCLNSTPWAHRLAAHRPYPDLPALLAAADEAAYDLSAEELTEALAAESLPALPESTYAAAGTALRAAHAAYESRFGHAFVICLDGIPEDESLNHVLTAIRSRLANDPEDERVVAADELRRLARQRLRSVARGARL
ncbi:2-oxo-4-hydroxy-4-carboxy-5-ureidoimidazoline decarboxylase [Streptomyces sp. NPDC090994]|uniref:2-oxo-4-hydroxy-4-carboxy-5-ureidoimidazoline decarboxylase n=1 Tax=Streptomyces sp. NPDC090994 TaxID=3365969 RepID=UPI00380B134E